MHSAVRSKQNVFRASATAASYSRGYTLIEMVVSVAIFSVVMLVATSAFLSLISLDRKARTTNDVVTNLSFVMESLARTIRTGSRYGCNGIGGGDCWPGGGHTFAFLDSNGCYQTISVQNSQVVETTQSGTSACTFASNIPLTDPRVTISPTELTFYVVGTTPGVVDATQPRVTITLHGTMTPDPKSPPVSFTIQTTAVQRYIDL